MQDDPGEESFIDSNVWLYAFINSDDPAKSALARECLASARPVVSAQVVNEVCVNLLRRPDYTEQDVSDLIRSFYADCRVIELNEPVLLQASDLRRQLSVSFWDSLILSAALIAGVRVLCTEDMQDGLTVNGSLQIRNPFVSA